MKSEKPRRRWVRCPAEKAVHCPFAQDQKPRLDDPVRGCPFECASSDPKQRQTCEAELVEVSRSPLPLWVAILLGLVLIATGWWLWPKNEPTPPSSKADTVQTVSPVPDLPPPPPPQEEEQKPSSQLPVVPSAPAPSTSVVLRLVATDPLGSELLPPLAKAWLEFEKQEDVAVVKGDEPDTLLVRGHPAGQRNFEAVSILNSAKDVRLQCLAENIADAVVSFRRARQGEVEELRRSVGDLRSNACEDVIALDAWAVAVHKTNPLSQITTRQLRDILGGTTLTDWSQIGGTPGAIRLFLPKGGTAALEAILETAEAHIPVLTGDRRHDSPAALERALASDPQGLGILPFRHAGVNSKALLMGDEEIVAKLAPAPFTISTETYRLRQRIYLHHCAVPPPGSRLPGFLRFVLDTQGQNAVASARFVDLNLKVGKDEETLPSAIARALAPETVQRIRRYAPLESVIYFRHDSKDLDNRALADLNRLQFFLTQESLRGKRLLLLGHSSMAGTDEYNLRLSRERAMIVKQYLETRDIHPLDAAGLGKQMPCASEDTPEGEGRNRRVEIWVVETR